MVILGQTGNNFGAGMSGGRAFVYDPSGVFPNRVNMEMVNLEALQEWSDGEEDELRLMIEEHVAETSSEIGMRLLADWAQERQHFVKVMPEQYKQALALLSREQSLDEAVA